MHGWVIEFVDRLGAVGVALLMLAENVFPPLPSEVIMPLAGYLSARGDMNFVLAIAAGTVGSLVGAAFWYWVGRRVSYERFCDWVQTHGIWLAMTPADVDRVVRWFEGRGRYAVLVGRVVPFVRTLISVPAGFSGMPLPRFLLLSCIGTAIWTTTLAAAGRMLGQQFEDVDRLVGWATWAFIAAAAVGYVYRVIRIRRSRTQQAQ
jgi:membrane protein DedA with SNARE-associated domain